LQSYKQYICCQTLFNVLRKFQDCGAEGTGWAEEKPEEGMPLTVNIILLG